ncbi:hypothetical protein IWX90DRAFT_286439 [Phyllosticta citrichinensis]|uniref:Uncharacterized protein n=1 Tax=Phyllosticta citrichinensis TaxID=1130410 RepID=A0ABR1XPM4_9PEZI
MAPQWMLDRLADIKGVAANIFPCYQPRKGGLEIQSPTDFRRLDVKLEGLTPEQLSSAKRPPSKPSPNQPFLLSQQPSPRLPLATHRPRPPLPLAPSSPPTMTFPPRPTQRPPSGTRRRLRGRAQPPSSRPSSRLHPCNCCHSQQKRKSRPSRRGAQRASCAAANAASPARRHRIWGGCMRAMAPRCRVWTGRGARRGAGGGAPGCAPVGKRRIQLKERKSAGMKRRRRRRCGSPSGWMRASRCRPSRAQAPTSQSRVWPLDETPSHWAAVSETASSRSAKRRRPRGEALLRCTAFPGPPERTRGVHCR